MAQQKWRRSPKLLSLSLDHQCKLEQIVRPWSGHHGGGPLVLEHKVLMGREPGRRPLQAGGAARWKADPCEFARVRNERCAAPGRKACGLPVLHSLFYAMEYVMPSRSLTPFTSMPGLLGDAWLPSIHREMNRLFDEAFRGMTVATDGSTVSSLLAPQVDVEELDGELRITADLPGVTQQDVDVQLDGDLLILSGERKGSREQQQSNHRIVERTRGQFMRRLQLPFAPDPSQIHARFENGELTIRIPKAGQQRSSHRIEVQGSGSSQGNGDAGTSSGGTGDTGEGRQGQGGTGAATP